MATDDLCESLTNLSEWMTHLPAYATKAPLCKVAIPGSHDSGAYWLDTSGPVCPAESSFIRTVCHLFGSCAKSIVHRWSVTQSMTISEQLQAGIRYVDLRTGYLKDEDDFFVVHGLYGHKTTEILQDILAFLKAHPKEVVILDFNHFYDFTDALHLRLAHFIASTFGSKLFAPNKKRATSSLEDIWSAGGQVIVCYDNATVGQKYNSFWNSSDISSPWANTDSLSHLVNFLNQRFSSIKADAFNVFQAILTPQTKTIVLHVSSSLKSNLALKCDAGIHEWLDGLYKEKHKGVNIVMCDFIDSSICVEETLKMNVFLKDSSDS